jgi:hypothetical protein
MNHCHEHCHSSDGAESELPQNIDALHRHPWLEGYFSVKDVMESSPRSSFSHHGIVIPLSHK